MIQKVTLQSIDVVEIEGEFKEVKGEKKVIPCMLTNYSVSKAKRQGLIKNSLITELLEMAPEGKTDNIDYKSIVDKIDEEKCLITIYVGCLGANKNLGLTYDEFLQNYNETFETNVKLYVDLISSLVKRDNNFADEFKKNTVSKKGKGEKK